MDIDNILVHIKALINFLVHRSGVKVDAIFIPNVDSQVLTETSQFFPHLPIFIIMKAYRYKKKTFIFGLMVL